MKILIHLSNLKAKSQSKIAVLKFAQTFALIKEKMNKSSTTYHFDYHMIQILIRNKP